MVFRLVYSSTYNWLVTNQPECGRKSDDNHNFKFISVKTWSKICPVRTVKATCLHSPLLSHSHVPYQNECSALWHPNYQPWNLFTYRYTGMLHLVSSLNSIVVSFSVFCFHFVSVIRHQVAKVARVAISVHIYLTRWIEDSVWIWPNPMVITTRWCHLSTITVTIPHCLVNSEGNINFLGTMSLVHVVVYSACIEYLAALKFY